MQHKLSFLSQQRDLLPTKPPESQQRLRLASVQVGFAYVKKSSPLCCIAYLNNLLQCLWRRCTPFSTI